jgi:hypothetical protein
MTTSISRRATQFFRERYELSPARGVTQKCPLGGMPWRRDPSPEGATGQVGVWCPGSGPSRRARATASVRLAAPSLPRM